MKKDDVLKLIQEVKSPDLGGFGTFSAGGSSINSEEGQLLYKLCVVLKPKVVVETGTHHGTSTNYFLEWASSHNGIVYTFDVETSSGRGLHRSKKYFLRQFKPQKILWFIKPSLEFRIAKIRSSFLSSIQKQKVDLFFHDSDHRYENASWEVQSILSHMNNPGYIVLHDVLKRTEEHATWKVLEKIPAQWKHIFQTQNGLGLIKL